MASSDDELISVSEVTGEDVQELTGDEVRVTVTSALSQRKADRRLGREPGNWAGIADEVMNWKGAKTYFAMVTTGLIARATLETADPRSLQSSGGAPGRYNAAAVWGIFFDHAEGALLLRLKRVPFNNSPFYGKRYLDASWDNVKQANREKFLRLIAIVDEIGQMSRDEAGEALRDFLQVIPDDPKAHIVVSRATSVDLEAMFRDIAAFLEDQSEGGRRGQAFVAACFALVHEGRIDTPSSVNDPSRTAPGDVRVNPSSHDVPSLFVEAKQKLVMAADISAFAKEVRKHSATGVAGYAALANEGISGRSVKAKLPSTLDVLDDEGLLMGIWSSSTELLSQSMIWSALDTSAAAEKFTSNFVFFLRHVGVEEGTLEELKTVAAGYGVTLELD